MKHYLWLKRAYKVLACDDESMSILFNAYGEIACEINGTPFDCTTVEEFNELVEFFRGETLEV